VLSTSLEGRIQMLTPTQWARSLSGHGTLRVDDPVLVNLNVLRTVFERLSILPGLVQRVEGRLPEAYRAKLAERDTRFAPIHLSAQIEKGWIRFSELEVHSDAFELTGAGRIGLDGTVEARTTLRIDRVLSEAIRRSVHELGALTNADGELELPVMIQGRAPRVAVIPDVNAVASQLVTATAVSILEDLLQAPEDEPTAPTSDDPVGGILRRLLQPPSQ
jgi:hypothetical protein